MPARIRKSLGGTLASAAAAVAALYGALTFVGCGGSDGGGGPPPPTKTTYQGTIYLASTSGGHIAVVPVTIDPSNAAAPITVGQLGMISLGTGTTHNFHDVRLDGGKLYYSAIKVDSSGGAGSGKTHLGWVDLANGNAVHDSVIDATGPAAAGMVYCGSGQTADWFVPMTMSYPAYIDAIPKSAIATAGADLVAADGTVKRTFVEDFRTGDANYIFAHGVNSPDESKLFVAVNEADALRNMTGSVTGYLLDMGDVVGGTVTDASVAASNTISGLTPGTGTIAFRSTYTPDGTKILQAGKDRLLVLNAADLSVLDNNAEIGGDKLAIENHDVMPTPDGKYAILALRFNYAGGGMQDSGLQLYDLANKTTVGNPVSTCNECHKAMYGGNVLAVPSNRATCGLDGALSVVTE